MVINHRLLLSLFFLILGQAVLFSQKTSIVFSKEDVLYIGDDIKYVAELFDLSPNSIKNKVYFTDIDNLPIDSSLKERTKRKSHNFYIHRNRSTETIYFGYASQAGLKAAYYYFLNKIGFRFLGFNEDWIIKPRKINLTKINTGLIERKINSIRIGLTGGMTLDKTDIKSFYKRNFLTNDYAASTHDFSSSIFYRQNKKEIEELNKLYPNNPILFEKNFPNLDNPFTLDLIKKWALKRVDSGKFPRGFSVSPADRVGNGEQTKYNPKSLPEVSNLYEIGWYVAIEIAKYIKSVRPNYTGKIIMNAYGNGNINVQPPKFDIPSNMSVVLIPYAFQTYYMTDYEMFEDWLMKKEKNNFSIQVYDYWSPTVWTQNGLPYQNLKNDINNRIFTWNKYPIDNLILESTGFMAITAPYLYAYGNYNQNSSNTSFDEFLDEYFKLSYGKSSKIIQELYYSIFSQRVTSDDLNEIFDKISKASAKNCDSKVARRLDDLKGYANFLYYYFENKKYASESSYKKLLDSAKRNSKSGFYQYTTLVNTNYGKIKPRGKLKNLKELNSRRSLSKLSSFKEISKKLNKNTKNKYRDNNIPETLDLSNFFIESNQAYKFNTYTKEKNIFSFKSASSDLIKFRFVAKKHAKIRIFSKEVGFDEILEFAENDDHYNFKPVLNRSYTIEINHNFKSFTLPQNTLFKVVKHRRRFLHSDMVYYFYVPKGFSKIIFDSKDKNVRFKFKENFMYPKVNGQFIDLGAPQKIKGTIYQYDVPLEFQDKVWKANLKHDDFEILNFKTIVTKQDFKLN